MVIAALFCIVRVTSWRGKGSNLAGKMDQSFEVGNGMLFSLSFKTGGADANWLGADQLRLGFVLRAGCRRVMMIT
jgi:hypothetical protein